MTVIIFITEFLINPNKKLYQKFVSSSFTQHCESFRKITILNDGSNWFYI